MRTIACAAILMTIVPMHRAIAQIGEDKIDVLRGLPSISLFVDSLDEASHTCGITEELIRDAFLYPISQSKLRLSANRSWPKFWVRVTTLIQRQPNQCISMVETAVFNYQPVELDYALPDALPTWADVRLCDAGAIIVGDRHAERIRAKIDEFTKKFITTWNLANRP